MHVRKKWAAAIGAVVLGVVMTGLVPIAANASVVTPPDDEPCYEWVDDTFKTIDNPDYVPGKDAVAPTEGYWTDGEWFNWTGGPVDAEPAFDADGWHGPLPHAPNGVPHNVEPGVYSTSDQGLASYFKHTSEWVPGTEGEDAVDPIGEPTIEVVDVPGHNVVVDCPPQDDDDDYVTVAWRMPSWSGEGATWPQSIQDHEGTEEPELDVLDGTLPDGCYQIDVYYDNETTTSLVAGGVLYGPSDPDEDLIPGGEGTAWKFLKVGEGECNPVDEPGVAAASWTGTVPTCLDLDGSGVFSFENASVSSATRVGDAENYASGFTAGTHDAPFDGVWTVTLTADEGFEFSGGLTTLVLEFTIEHLTAEECEVVPPPVCSATEDTSHWQRYSWVGGPIPEGVIPEFLGADDENWQANTASDPHKIGVAGAYDRSHGSSGNADWFYLEWVDQPACPTIVTPTLTWTVPVCESWDSGVITADPIEGVIWESVGNEDGSQTVTASPAEGYAFPEEAQTEWLVPDIRRYSLECGAYPDPTLFNAEPEPATCLAPGSFDDGALGGVQTGQDENWRDYQFENFYIWVYIGTPGEVTIYVFAEDGYTLFGLDETKWDVSEDGASATRTIPLAAQLSGEVACPTDSPPPPDDDDNPPTPVDNPGDPVPPTLSQTGFEGMTGLYGSLALLVAGAGLLVTRRLVRR